MSRQLFFEEQPTSLIPSILLEDYVAGRILAKRSPFYPPSFIRRKIEQLARLSVRFFQKILGEKFYVKNNLYEMQALDPAVRSLLFRLLDKKIISSWCKVSLAPDQPRIAHCELTLCPIKGSSGQTLLLQGSHGGGVGYTFNDALIPALAETLERYSLCSYKSEKIIYGNFDQLKHKGAVSPSSFLIYSKNQLCARPQKLGIIEKQKFGWIKTTSFITGGKALVPAQLVYINYGVENPHEFSLSYTTTNGAAAGKTFKEAAYRALCEAIERDGLYMFWLNKIAPPRIELSSIPSSRVQLLIETIARHKLELYILDITTDLKLPSFCAVLIDKYGNRAVSMSTVGGFDHLNEIEKLLLEVLKFVHCEKKGNKSFKARIIEKYPLIETIEERRVLWQEYSMVPQIQFFLSGAIKQFADIKNPCIQMTISNRLSYLKKIFRKKGYSCYSVDVTSYEARRAGLYVVKMITPNLSSVFFNEKNKGLGSSRLYAVPVVLGLRNAPMKEEEINTIPIPFL